MSDYARIAHHEVVPVDAEAEAAYLAVAHQLARPALEGNALSPVKTDLLGRPPGDRKVPYFDPGAPQHDIDGTLGLVEQCSGGSRTPQDHSLLQRHLLDVLPRPNDNNVARMTGVNGGLDAPGRGPPGCVGVLV